VNNTIFNTLLIALLVLFVSCGQEPSLSRVNRGDATDRLSAQTTGSLMPCGCSEQYDPVCGENNVQFTNACVANCYGVNYSMGFCQGGTQSFCNSDSGHVCGQPPMPECSAGQACATVMPAPRTYANECVMMQARASLVHVGLCH
jgi:hypothetical protein